MHSAVNLLCIPFPILLVKITIEKILLILNQMHLSLSLNWYFLIFFSLHSFTLSHLSATTPPVLRLHKFV